MLLITTRGKYGVVSGNIHGVTYDVLRDAPGLKKFTNGELLFDLSLSNLEYLSRHLANAIWDKSSKQRLQEALDKREALEDAAKRKAEAVPENISFEFKTQPYEHQKKAFFLSRDRQAYALFMEMGTGKTKVTLDTIAYLWAQGEITSVLILAPNGVHRQWVTEQIPAHLPRFVRFKAAYYVSNPSAEQKREIEEVMQYTKGLRILTANIESLSNEKGVTLLRSFLQSDRENLFVIDESVLIKTPSSTRTKNALKLAGYSKYRRILSGAPVTKGIEDLYTQFRFLDPDIIGYSSFYAFRSRYCVMGGWENKAVVEYQNVDELRDRIEPHSFRVRKKDCLDLPDKIYITKPVHLTDEQMKMYRKLCKEYLISLENGNQLTVLNGGVLITRLQQLICGFLPDENNTIHELVSFASNPRLVAVSEILGSVDGKIIIWARFNYDIKNLSKLLAGQGIPFVLYHGETPENDRIEAINSFRTDEHVRVFIGNPAAAGTGLNLAVANTVIYYSNNFDANIRWQSEDRTHRIGMTGSCTYIDLISPNTVDQKIVDTLKSKKSVSDIIIDNDALARFLS